MRFIKKCQSVICAHCPTFSPSASLWHRCEVPPTRHSLVTAYLQRSQAWASGTAPRSRLGYWGVSQETQHKYGDPNNWIANGAIRPRILESYSREDAFVWGRGNWGVGGQWSCLDNHNYGLCSFAVGHFKMLSVRVSMEDLCPWLDRIMVLVLNRNWKMLL